MAVDEIQGVRHYIGLSTDEKPSGQVYVGSTFFETDTGLRFEYGSGAWSVEASSLAGGDVSPVNSTAVPLAADTGGADHIFTGEAVEIVDVAMVTVNVFSDVASAEDGLDIQQSSDGTNWDHHDNYTIPANDGQVFTPNKAAKFMRIVYTNGTTVQTVFRLQTILNYVNGKASSHRVKDNLSSESDAPLSIAVIKVPTNDPLTLKSVDVQNPFPTDGDSVYAKDLDLASSSLGTFDSGTIESLFNDYLTEISDVTATSPKEFTLWFRRSITTLSVGLGSITGNFSNVKLQFKDQTGAVRYEYDDSANSTPYTSRVYPLEDKVTFIALTVQFLTTNQVKISGMNIPKILEVNARIQGQKPDGTLQTFQSTASGNSKVSLEEYDPTFNTNPLPVIQTDLTGRKAELDSLFKVPIGITVQHHEIHEGDSFLATANATLALAGTLGLSFKTSNTAKWAHMEGIARAVGEANICIWEGVTVTGGTGTAQEAFNRNRNSSNITSLLENVAGTGFAATGFLALNATVSLVGAKCIYEEHFGSGKSVGGGTQGRNEILMKQDTEYLIVITSEAAGNNCELILDWYEHTGA